MLAELLDLAVPEVVPDEFDLAALVFLLAFRGRNDGEEFPIGVMDGFLKIVAETGAAGVGMSGFDEVIREPEKEGAVARAHEFLGGFRQGLVLMKAEAAVLIAFGAFTGAEGNVALLGDFFESLGHARVIGGVRGIAMRGSNCPLTSFSFIPRLILMTRRVQSRKGLRRFPGRIGILRILQFLSIQFSADGPTHNLVMAGSNSNMDAGFIVVPIPEPSSFGLFAFGAWPILFRLPGWLWSSRNRVAKTQWQRCSMP